MSAPRSRGVTLKYGLIQNELLEHTRLSPGQQTTITWSTAMALLRKQAIINAVVNANDASMVSMAEASMVEDVTFMSDNPEENASLMDTSCCSKMADTTMHSIDKTDLSMFEEDMSYMEDEADDPNYSMLSLPEGECSYMDVETTSN